jgi:hypothetical protein
VKDYLGVKPIVILLDGELGGGKTTWTKYFAEHFGIQGIISPTYTYECEYEVPSLPFSSLRGVENDMKPRSAGSTLLYSDKVGNTIGTISSGTRHVLRAKAGLTTRYKILYLPCNALQFPNMRCPQSW